MFQDYAFGGTMYHRDDILRPLGASSLKPFPAQFFVSEQNKYIIIVLHQWHSFAQYFETFFIPRHKFNFKRDNYLESNHHLVINFEALFEHQSLADQVKILHNTLYGAIQRGPEKMRELRNGEVLQKKQTCTKSP